MDSQQVEQRQRLAIARIEDAAQRLAALAHRRHLPREAIDETDPRQAMLRETEITADALDFIVALLLPQPVPET
ncbi:MAG TPA: hypothetical protein VFO07_01020 [Roseiflexaceae bacterium]|nr:hypothetical protein [Roseiflexaceae bacterium]